MSKEHPKKFTKSLTVKYSFFLRLALPWPWIGTEKIERKKRAQVRMIAGKAQLLIVCRYHPFVSWRRLDKGRVKKMVIAISRRSTVWSTCRKKAEGKIQQRRGNRCCPNRSDRPLPVALMQTLSKMTWWGKKQQTTNMRNLSVSFCAGYFIPKIYIVHNKILDVKHLFSTLRTLWNLGLWDGSGTISWNLVKWKWSDVDRKRRGYNEALFLRARIVESNPGNKKI